MKSGEAKSALSTRDLFTRYAKDERCGRTKDAHAASTSGFGRGIVRRSRVRGRSASRAAPFDEMTSIPMRMLRNQAIKGLLAELDRTIFTQHAFEATFNSRDGKLIELVYRERPDFTFIMRQIHSSNFQTVEFPGVDFLDEQTYSVRDLADTASRMRNWTQRILEELTVQGPSYPDFVKKLRTELEERSEHLSEPDKPFSEAESKEWIDKLDGMSRKFEELREANEMREAELRKVKEEIKNLKEQITKVPKKTWVNLLGTNL